MPTAIASNETADGCEAHVLLGAWRDERPTGLYSRRRVIDNLLDLRNVLPEAERFVVDRILADIPGVTVVESEWWLDQLEGLRTALDDRVTG